MAQTKRKRRRKHRGTQGGRVDARPKGRPRNRAEAKQRARARGSSKSGRPTAQERFLTPPTWRSAFLKGLGAAGIFFVLIVVAFGRPAASAAPISLLMMGFYVPMAYLTDRFFHQRALRKQARERLARAQGGGEDS